MEELSIKDEDMSPCEGLGYKRLPVGVAAGHELIVRQIEPRLLPMGQGPKTLKTLVGCGRASGTGRAGMPVRRNSRANQRAVVDLPEPMIPSTKMRRDRSIAPFLQMWLCLYNSNI